MLVNTSSLHDILADCFNNDNHNLLAVQSTEEHLLKETLHALGMTWY